MRDAVSASESRRAPSNAVRSRAKIPAAVICSAGAWIGLFVSQGSSTMMTSTLGHSAALACTHVKNDDKAGGQDERFQDAHLTPRTVVGELRHGIAVPLMTRISYARSGLTVTRPQ